MKNIPLFFALALIFILPGIADSKDYVVRKVLSGDTVQLDTGETVKYLGVETPKLNTKGGGAEFYAREATRYNKKLVFMKKVRLEFDQDRKDQQGRLLAYVFVKDLFVNAELVRLGYAKASAMPPNTKHQEMLANLEKKAAEESRGLWQETKKDTEPYYVGNKRTYTLHRPSCKYVEKIPAKDKIIFRNRADALKIGYTPDKYCKP
ncbi:MAG TPA: thermonuclease family protein [Syntrophorhabdaceae bacterium]|nr:thermonuclease family protein [Syntrophorhabdaceae bacterium]HQM82050.1 thermonuclease family protein [Syntrophorhabdaceae bacterium]